jgi:hypothetical protein
LSIASALIAPSIANAAPQVILNGPTGAPIPATTSGSTTATFGYANAGKCSLEIGSATPALTLNAAGDALSGSTTAKVICNQGGTLSIDSGATAQAAALAAATPGIPATNVTTNLTTTTALDGIAATNILSGATGLSKSWTVTSPTTGDTALVKLDVSSTNLLGAGTYAIPVAVTLTAN